MFKICAIFSIKKLNNSLVKLTNLQNNYMNDPDYHRVIIANLFASLDWFMNFPLSLMKDSDKYILAGNIFKVNFQISW